MLAISIEDVLCAKCHGVDLVCFYLTTERNLVDVAVNSCQYPESCINKPCPPKRTHMQTKGMILGDSRNECT